MDKFKRKIDVRLDRAKYKFVIIPTFGVIDLKHHYGYQVYAIGFLWLKWAFRIAFGVRKYIWKDDENG